MDNEEEGHEQDEFDYAKKDMDYMKNQTLAAIKDKFNTLKVSDVSRFIKENTTKKQILSSIAEGVVLALKKDAGTLKIYYTGHGVKKTGDWQGGFTPSVY